MNFRGTRPLPSKIACDFRRQRSVSSDSGSPQILLESEGTAVLPIPKESKRKARFYSLCPVGAEEKNTRIGGDPFSLIPIFPPTPGPLRFQRNLRGRPFFRFACFFPLPLRGRGKKNLRHAPANPFMRFARRAVNRKERQDFFPEPFMARFSHGIFDSGEKSRRKKREFGKNPSFFFQKKDQE